MMSAKLVFVDTNTVWQRRIAEALNQKITTIAVEPRAVPGPREHLGHDTGNLQTLRPKVPAGWASRTAFVGQRLLGKYVRGALRNAHDLRIVIHTNPHYHTLAAYLGSHVRQVYYCADDYDSYVGWGGETVADAEARILCHCETAVFVSEALRERAIDRHSLDPARTFTSPNATETRFLRKSDTPTNPPASCQLARPIVGVSGAASPRLDLALLERVANLSEIGTLLIIGPGDHPAAGALVAHPKVVATGRLPHSEMHRWAHCLDVALVPYAPQPINRFCSPMRLYDHLAARSPIFATDACDQINRLASGAVSVFAPSELPDALSQWLASSASRVPRASAGDDVLWSARATALAAFLETAPQ